MIREIVTDPIILGMKSSPASREDIQIVRDLLDTVRANSKRCVGMAANMIGEHKTILTALIGKDYIVMINPKIISKSRQSYEAQESCLSLTGVRPAIRYKTIEVEYLDKNFKRQKKIFKDFEAQIIQHEIDHFSGILI